MPLASFILHIHQKALLPAQRVHERATANASALTVGLRLLRHRVIQVSPQQARRRLSLDRFQLCDLQAETMKESSFRQFWSPVYQYEHYYQETPGLI